MNKAIIEIPLVGGLGNQLFILSFGIFVAESYGFKVRLIQTTSSKGNQTHGIRLANQLSMEGLPVEVVDQTPLRRFSSSLGRRLSKSSCFLGKRVFGRTYLSESDFLMMQGQGPREFGSGTYQVHGYFQEQKYLQQVQELGYLNQLDLASPSAWFTESLSAVKSLGRVGMHVRRGDTVKIAEHGVLSIEYYQRAILSLRKEELMKPILVFSDEPEALREEFSDLLKLADLEFVSPPEGSSAIESMVLMSFCSTLIISNSTFSWWAASVGKASSRVICPETWSPLGKKGVSSSDSRRWEFLAPTWRVSGDK